MLSMCFVVYINSCANSSHIRHHMCKQDPITKRPRVARDEILRDLSEGRQWTARSKSMLIEDTVSYLWL